MSPTTSEQAKFEGWAVVEVMGHQTHIGYVTTEAYGQAVMFRVDTPALPEREFTLSRPDWSNDYGSLPAGAKVRKPATESRSVLIGSGSIYRITPCTEQAAQVAIDRAEPRSLIPVDLPKAQLTAPDEDDEASEDEEFSQPGVPFEL